MISAATSDGDVQMLPAEDPRATIPANNAKPARAMRIAWAKRLPRKPRCDAYSKRKPSPVLIPKGFGRRDDLDRDGCRASKRRRLDVGRPLKAPATMEGTTITLHGANTRAVAGPVVKIARLSAGRSLPRLLELMDFHLFHNPPNAALHRDLMPREGLFATFQDSPAFIVDVVHRYRIPFADIIRLKEKTGSDYFIARLKDVQTVKQAQLTNIGTETQVIGVHQEGGMGVCHSDSQAVRQSVRMPSCGLLSSPHPQGSLRCHLSLGDWCLQWGAQQRHLSHRR